MAKVNDLVVRGSATVSSMKVVGNTNLLGNTNLEGETTVEGSIKFQSTSTEGNLFPDNTDTVKYLMNFVYPVGSYFITQIYDLEAVKNHFGGEWEQVTSGHFLEACDSGAGGTMKAGLPNLKGAFAFAQTDYSGDYVNWQGGDEGPERTDGKSPGRLFTQADSDSTGRKIDGLDSYVKCRIMNFNANTYNEIYGNSSTVQPKSRKVYIYYRTGLYNG